MESTSREPSVEALGGLCRRVVDFIAESERRCAAEFTAGEVPRLSRSIQVHRLYSLDDRLAPAWGVFMTVFDLLENGPEGSLDALRAVRERAERWTRAVQEQDYQAGSADSSGSEAETDSARDGFYIC